MIEPAEQNFVRIDERLGTKICRANPIAPRNVHPRPGEEVLMLLRKFTARGLAQCKKAIDAAAKEHVIPAGNVQRGNADFFKATAHIERGPVIIGSIVI